MRLLSALFALFLPVLALAQYSEQYAEWVALSDRVATVLENEAAESGQVYSNDAYDDLRRELDTKRADANALILSLQPKLAPLEEQLAALGKAPEDGASESASITQSREALQEQINDLKADIALARQASERAGSQIVAIDNLMRKRASQALLTRNRSPLSLSALNAAIGELFDHVAKLRAEITHNFNQQVSSGQAITNWPTSFILLVISLAMIIAAPKRITRAMTRLDRNSGWFAHLRRLTPTIIAILSAFLLQVVVRNAVMRLGLFGTLGSVWVDFFIDAGLFVIFALWVGRNITNYAQTKAPSHGSRMMLAFVGAALIHLPIGAQVAELTIPAEQVYNLIFLSFGALSLWRLSSVARLETLLLGQAESSLNRMFDIMRRIIRYMSVIALLLAVLGYFAASRQLFIGAAGSLVLVVLARHIYVILADIVHFAAAKLTQKDAPSERALALGDMALGTIIGLIAIPFALLIWGASENDLREIWTWLSSGVQIGEVQLSATSVIRIIIVFAVGYFIVRGLQRVLNTFILPRTGIDIGAHTAIVALVGYVGYTLAAIFAIRSAGIDLSNLAFIAGALSVGIGFGLQNIVSNFVSGIILLIERPIRKGDWIAVSGVEGYVRDISVRSTKIETFDRATVIVPNADLVSTNVLNWLYSDKTARVIVPIGVAYASDPRVVEEILLEVAEESEWAVRIPKPFVVFQGFGDSAMNFELRFFIRQADYMVTARSDTNFAIYKKFKERGISIPFPQRELHVIGGTVAAESSN